ncbi:MAG TPA: DUF748 domain-containing protein, partial [Bacteroidia bacterium]|nr:DUF748 domain-containing protein [Bacteroidia bacterium]
KNYEISSITLDHPWGIIIQNNKDLNFDDLIDKFSSNDSTPIPNKAPVHFSILDIKIEEGAFYYNEKQTPINYFIKNVNIESPGYKWDKDTLIAKISLLPGIGTGTVKGNFKMNLKNKDYYIDALIRKLDLNIIDQYLKELTNYGTFRANLDADIKSKGNFTDKQNLTMSGTFAVNDFHFGKNIKEDYTSFEKLNVSIEELSPKKHTYLFDSISLISPYFKYEKYDHLDNLETIFGENGGNITAANSAKEEKFNLIIEIGQYIKDISKNFFRSPYKVDRLVVSNANFKFNDFSLGEKFSASLNPLSFYADSIDKNHKRVNCILNSGIKPYGKLAIEFSINPKDSTDFDIQCRLQNIPISVFNPYITSYTSFPLDRGTLEFNAIWHVNNGIIKSSNHLVIVDPRVTKRVRNKDTRWIPVPLIMAFIRERGNVIDYEIPITGDLKNPKFHLSDVVFDVIKNIFVKPPTIPYRIKVKNIETEIEKSLTIKWQMRNDALLSSQKKFIEKMTDFLTETPEAVITIYPEMYTDKEKEHILFFEAKKKYFLETHHQKTKFFTEADSEMVEKMSVKDSFFVHYLNKHIKTTAVFTIQEKCAGVIDSNSINTKLNQLNKERKNIFISFFKAKDVEKQVKFKTGESIVPYDGFSFYRIEYKNKFPESLVDAYLKMNELNDLAPRKKFKKEHQKYLSELQAQK